MGKKFVGLDVLLGKTAVCVIGDYGKCDVAFNAKTLLPIISV
jgi:hypothetical protein